ncbi:AI-2E family transporter [Sedimentitalea sp. HM32M-2]|uniref:AI-2E family transporter n=1 Tax=Sedimentitalea sp. HM32M-2 TaxID=3351566 RepID=UPI003624C3B3
MMTSRVEHLLMAIATVLVFVALRQAQEFLAPVIGALVAGIVLSPVSGLWDRWGLRASMAAFATVLLAFIALGALGLLLEPYVSEAIDSAPIIWFEMRGAIENLRSFLLGLDEIAEDVAKAVNPNGDGAPEKEATVPIPRAQDALFYAPQAMAQVLVFTGTLYFFLLTRRQIYEWAGRQFDGVRQNDFFQAEREVARYFLTITAINASFGVLIALVMQGFGMPAPFAWGLLAFLLNFVVYVGPTALAAALLLAGLVAFDGVMSIAPAAVYMMMNAFEGQFVTPALVGQSMAVNPLLVFLSLVFWLWLWGPLGGIIAIPLLIWGISLSATRTR